MEASKNYYKRVMDTILTCIRAGTYQEGDKVPSTADMAKELNMSKQAVIYAYDLMNALGYLETRAGIGTYVATNALPTLRARHTLFSLPCPPSGHCHKIQPPDPPQKAIQHLKLNHSEAPLRFGRGFSDQLHELYYIHPQFEIHMAPDEAPVDEYLRDEWGIPVEEVRYNIHYEGSRDKLPEPLWIKAGNTTATVEIAAYTLNMKPLYWGLQLWGLPLGISLGVIRREGDRIIEKVNVNIEEESCYENSN